MSAMLEPNWLSAAYVEGARILLDAAIKASIILAGAGAAAVAFRRASAAARHLIWTLAIVALLLVPVLAALTPTLNLPILPPRRAAAGAGETGRAAAPLPGQPRPAAGTRESPRPGNLPTPAEPAATGVPAPSGHSLVPRPPQPERVAAAAEEASAPPVPAAADHARPGGRGWGLHWTAWVLLAWAAGALAALTPMVIGVVGVRRLARRAETVADGPWPALLRQLSAKLRLRRPVALLRSDRAAMPATWGLWRPVILLPDQACDWPAERRRAVLLHELAHVKRWDCATQLLLRIVRAAYWFNPLVWLAAWRLRVERERACDDLVLAGGGRPSDYAAHLLDMVRALRCPGHSAWAAVAIARRRGFEGRLRAILDRMRSRRPLSRAAVIVALAALMCVVCPLAALRPAARADTEQTTRPAAKLKDLWQDLGAEEYEKAYGAARGLAARGDEAAALLGDGLKPPPADARRIRQLIAELESESYKLRTRAFEQLALIGPPAEPALRKAVRQSPSAEARSRAQKLLDVFADPAKSTRREAWAVRVLETIDTDRSRGVLQKLAAAAPQTWLSTRAKAALDRLAEADRLLAKPTPAKLEFRVIPTLRKVPKAVFSPEEAQKYIKELGEKGPQPGDRSGPRFVWREAACELPESSIVSAYKGRRYVLLWHYSYAAPRIHLSPSDPWELIKVAAVTDEEALPAIRFELGKHARHPGWAIKHDWYRSAGDYLAMLVGGKVIALARTYVPKERGEGVFACLLPARRLTAMVKCLRAGMIPVTHFAEMIEAGNLEKVKEMLADYPALLHIKKRPRGYQNATPFQIAVWRRFEIAEYLLKQGADINAPGYLGRTALHSAADGGNVKALEFLIKHGANLEALDKNGMTPLHCAVSEDHRLEAARLLLDAGADVNATGKVGITPLFLELLIASWETRPDELKQAKACIDLLTSRGAELDVFTAAGLGRLEKVKAFVAKNPAAAKAKAFYDTTALHLAALGGQLPVVKFLLAHGADAGASNKWIGTPLHCAARKGHADVARLLIQRNVDLLAKDREGDAPIHVAAFHGHADIVEALLDAGVDVHVAGNHGRTPLAEAARGGRIKVVELLLDKQAELRETLLHALCEGVYSIHGPRERPGQDFIASAKLLIAKGAPVNGRDGRKRTPLHCAAGMHTYWRGKAPLRAPLVKLFIAAGANVNARDRRGWTALHHAADKADAEAVAALLEAGADPLVEDQPLQPHGQLPLEVVSHPDGEKVGQLLRTHMAPRLAAAEKQVIERLTAFLEAVRDGDEATWKKITVPNRHCPEARWAYLVSNLQKDYAGAADRLTNVIGAKTRSGWATAMIQRPEGDKEKYTLFTLLRLPDGSWGVLNATHTSREPGDAVRAWLGNNRIVYREVRNAIYDAAGVPAALHVETGVSMGLPLAAGKVAITAKDGRLRIETPEKRRWQTWALEVHERLAKLWDGGELTLARRVVCRKGSVRLVAENGKATWREGGRQLVMFARGGSVHVEARDGKDAPLKVIDAAKLTVEWEGGLRLVPAAVTAPASRPAKAGP